MPIVYEKAGPDFEEFVREAREKFHGQLNDHGVTTSLVVARNADKPLLPALKLHGYPCLAIAKITPYRQRVEGVADTSITFDELRWEKMPDADKLALCDHELTHFVLARDQNDVVKTDDLGRPKLRMRLHDFELGGFQITAERHGSAAPEVQVFRRIVQAYRQCLMPWGDDSAGSAGLTDASIAKIDAEMKSQFGPNVSVTRKGRNRGKDEPAQVATGE